MNDTPWREPNAIGYVRLYFQVRNCQNPLYARANRAMCRYWIRQERRRRYLARAASVRERAAAISHHDGTEYAWEPAEVYR